MMSEGGKKGGATQTREKLKVIMRKMFNDGEVVGISLKKVNVM